MNALIPSGQVSVKERASWASNLFRRSDKLGEGLHSMRKTIGIVVVLVLLFNLTAWAGLGSKQTMYVGGTVSAIPANTESVLNLSGDSMMDFKWKTGDWQIPYSSVTSLEYGQHAGRRVGATVALGVTTLGIGALPLLFSKKRRHYLTIGYTDGDGKAQAAIFELGKDAIRTSLTILETRTGKKTGYEDEEARKAGTK